MPWARQRVTARSRGRGRRADSDRGDVRAEGRLDHGPDEVRAALSAEEEACTTAVAKRDVTRGYRVILSSAGFIDSRESRRNAVLDNGVSTKS